MFTTLMIMHYRSLFFLWFPLVLSCRCLLSTSFLGMIARYVNHTVSTLQRILFCYHCLNATTDDCNGAGARISIGRWASHFLPSNCNELPTANDVCRQ